MRTLFIFFLLFSVCYASGTLYDSVAINLTYSKDPPKDKDIELFIENIKKYRIADNVFILKRRIPSEVHIWRSQSIMLYESMSYRLVLRPKADILYISMNYLPGIYITHTGNIAVGMAKPQYMFIAVFYGDLHSRCVSSVMLHELMHLLKIRHCKNKKCVMYPIVGLDQRELKKECLDVLKKKFEKN